MKLFQKVTIDRCGDPYLFRYILIECRWFKVMIHKFLRGDGDKEMHDHPWAFMSVILKGGYSEDIPLYQPVKDESLWWQNAVEPEKMRYFKAGSVLFRPAEWKHKVYITPGSKPVWTLVITGPRKRKWGFWDGDKFTPWREFVSGLRCD